MEITFYKDMEGYEKFVNNNEEDLENCIESGYISHISNVTMENVYEIVAQDILEQDIEDLTYLYNEVNEKKEKPQT